MDKLIEVNAWLHDLNETLRRATPGNIAHTAGNSRVLIQAAMMDMEQLIKEAQETERFMQDVIELRRYQTAFFGCPPGDTKQHNLQQAKLYEAKVDKFVKNRLSKQQTLPL